MIKILAKPPSSHLFAFRMYRPRYWFSEVIPPIACPRALGKK
ncbi:MAG: hypothetical protein ABIK97_06625 [candidate division WOR-3 bacterium]